MAIESILALDLATAVGWARWRSPDSMAAGNKLLPKTGADVGQFVFKFAYWFTDLLSVEKPTLVVFEAALINETTHLETARKLLGLAVMVEYLCKLAGVEALEVKIPDVRSHFLGTGFGKHALRRPGEFKQWQAIRRMTFEACNRKGWFPETDDEGDAYAVLDYAAHCLRNRVRVPWDARPAGAWGEGPDGKLRLVGPWGAAGDLPGLVPGKSGPLAATWPAPGARTR